MWTFCDSFSPHVSIIVVWKTVNKQNDVWLTNVMYASRNLNLKGDDVSPVLDDYLSGHYYLELCRAYTPCVLSHWRDCITTKHACFSRRVESVKPMAVPALIYSLVTHYCTDFLWHSVVYSEVYISCTEVFRGFQFQPSIAHELYFSYFWDQLLLLLLKKLNHCRCAIICWWHWFS